MIPSVGSSEDEEIGTFRDSVIDRVGSRDEAKRCRGNIIIFLWLSTSDIASPFTNIHHFKSNRNIIVFSYIFRHPLIS